MSLLGKRWVILDPERKTTLLESLLSNRGVSDTEQFLKPDWDRDLNDPYLMEEMGRVVERIRRAKDEKQIVMVAGDYDIDGISGTALLCGVLKKLGIQAIGRLPHRVNDGYGLSVNIIRGAHELGVGLIITVDNGISCGEEIEFANTCGIDVIITDHHTIPEQYPNNAYAVLHPKKAGTTYPFSELAGVGVAFKLTHALANEFFPEEAEAYLKWCLDLVVLGTIADCSDLKMENRLLVKMGLKVLKRTQRVGLRELLAISSQETKPMSTETIGFRLAPRLNAAGRLESAETSLRLLLTDDVTEAREIAQRLNRLNQQRQIITSQMMELAESKLHDRLLTENILIEKDATFHAGVVGLVAGKLAEKYNRPVIILEDRGNLLTASARSIESCDILAAIKTQKHLLERFGGHAQAAGFSIKPENYDLFRTNMEKLMREQMTEEEMKPLIRIDCAITEHEVCEETIVLLRSMEPCGIGNVRPTFLMRDAHVVDARCVGNDNAHLKLTLQRNGHHVQAIGFHMGRFLCELSRDSTIDVVFHLSENEWQGMKSIQLEVRDIRVSS